MSQWEEFLNTMRSYGQGHSREPSLAHPFGGGNVPPGSVFATIHSQGSTSQTQSAESRKRDLDSQVPPPLPPHASRPMPHAPRTPSPSPLPPPPHTHPPFFSQGRITCILLIPHRVLNQREIQECQIATHQHPKSRLPCVWFRSGHGHGKGQNKCCFLQLREV